VCQRWFRKSLGLGDSILRKSAQWHRNGLSAPPAVLTGKHSSRPTRVLGLEAWVAENFARFFDTIPSHYSCAHPELKFVVDKDGNPVKKGTVSKRLRETFAAEKGRSISDTLMRKVLQKKFPALRYVPWTDVCNECLT
jgi:hypothetical protein